MLTISRPPPRRCSAACLLGSATRRFCTFFRLPLAAPRPFSMPAPCFMFVQVPSVCYNPLMFLVAASKKCPRAPASRW